MTSEAWSVGCARVARALRNGALDLDLVGEALDALCSRDQAFVIIDTSCVHCNSSHAPSGRDRSHPNPRRRLPLPANLQTAAGSVNRNEVFESR